MKRKEREQQREQHGDIKRGENDAFEASTALYRAGVQKRNLCIFKQLFPNTQQSNFDAPVFTGNVFSCPLLKTSAPDMVFCCCICSTFKIKSDKFCILRGHPHKSWLWPHYSPLTPCDPQAVFVHRIFGRFLLSVSVLC